MDILKELRKYVRYNDLVQNMDLNPIRRSINEQLSSVQTDLATNDFDTEDLKSSISGKHLEILKILEDIDSDLNRFKQGLKQTVTELAIPYYTKSEHIEKHGVELPRLEKLSRLKTSDLLYNEESKQLLVNAITSYIHARYSVCQIQPGYGEITNDLVAGTPMYIVETEDFPSIVNTDFFNSTMTRRINWYSMNEQDSDPLNKLPQGQIGCVVVVDYFNFKTVPTIKTFLHSIYNVLRSGGVAIFTYNNCDYPKGIDKVDEMYYCYTTEDEMTSVCKEVGFEIIRSVVRGYDELDNGISWLEVKKPGELSSIRAAQGLATIENL